MTLMWIAGTFNNGYIDMSLPLPVTATDGTVNIDVNGAQKATIKVARDEFPNRGYWRTNFKRYDTLIALIDDAEPWNSPNAVLFAGYLSAIPATIGESLTMQVSGLREYWAVRYVNRTYNDIITNPKTEYDYEASTWQGVMKKLILEAHTTDGIPSNAAKPPQILGTVDGYEYGTGKVYPVFPANLQKYTDIIEDIRDIASNDGNEYQIIPRFADSSRNRIVFDVRIGSDTNPHIREDQSMTINLVTDEHPNDDATFKTLGFQLNQEGDNYFNRLIIQSKAGEDTSGADLQTVTTIGGPSILVDGAFNPNIELTDSEMTTQKNERIVGATKEQLTGVLTISGHQGTWLNRLGMMLNFQTQEGVSDGFGGEMRFTDIKFSSSDNKINVGFLTKQIRYTKLPRTPTKDALGGGGGVPGKNTSGPVNGGGTPWNWPGSDGKGGSPSMYEGGSSSGSAPKPSDNWEDPNKLWNTSPTIQPGGVFTAQTNLGNQKMLQDVDVWGDGFETGIDSAQQGPEGVTIIPDKKGQRFYGLDYVASVTKPHGDKPRYAPIPMSVWKSAKFTAYPTYSEPDYYGNVTPTNNYGVEGVGSKFGEITSEMIAAKMMDDTPPAEATMHWLQFERLATGSVIQEEVDNNVKYIVVYFHQLQVFTNTDVSYPIGSTFVRSSNFAFRAYIDPTTGDMTGNWTDFGYPFRGDNSDEYTYYADNKQVESYGSRNHMAIMVSPQRYPKLKKYNIGYAGPTTTDPTYFKKIKMGKYSVSTDCIVHNFEQQTWFKVPGPVPDQYQTFNLDDDKNAENHWNTLFQIRCYNDEFWAVSIKDETRYTGYNWGGTNGSGQEGPIYLKVAYKAKVDPDNGSGPGAWSKIAEIPSTMRSGASYVVHDKTDLNTPLYRIACFKGMVQIPGFDAHSNADIGLKMPEDYYQGWGIMVAGKTNTYAVRVLYNSTNGNPGGVAIIDTDSVTNSHMTMTTGSFYATYNWLDFSAQPINPPENGLSGVQALWQDFGDKILPIWNVGYYAWSSSSMVNIGSHNGKFLEIENNFVVSPAPTQSRIFTKNQEGSNYYGTTWAWRK